MPRALPVRQRFVAEGALPYLACTSRPCWGKASFDARWAARFELMQCVCGAAGVAAGGGGRNTSVFTRHVTTNKEQNFRGSSAIPPLTF